MPKHCPKASPKHGKLIVITVVWIQNMRASVIKDSQRARHLLSIPLKGTCVPTVITTQLPSTKQTTHDSDRGDQLTHTSGCRGAMRWKQTNKKQNKQTCSISSRRAVTLLLSNQLIKSAVIDSGETLLISSLQCSFRSPAPQIHGCKPPRQH